MDVDAGVDFKFSYGNSNNANKNHKNMKHKFKTIYKPCKNHYGSRKPDSCGSTLPFCCPYSTASEGYCRNNMEQCATSGLIDESKHKNITDKKKGLDVNRIKKLEKRLSDSEKEYHNFKLSNQGAELRKNMISDISKKNKAPGCSMTTLQLLGPFAASDITSYYINELNVDPRDINNVPQKILCFALNRAIIKYQKEPQIMSLHSYLKRNILDYVLRQIIKQNERIRQENEEAGITVPMRDSP